MKQVKFITGLMAFGVVSLFAGCGEKENEMTKVTLNEVAHSIFYAHSMSHWKMDILHRKASISTW